jgi:L-iditol 2-dehydrogenase
MKTVIVRAPMDFSVEEVPIPPCPEGGLLLKVHACGLCGSDLRTLRHGHRKVTLPWTIGHEISGQVVEVGKRGHSTFSSKDDPSGPRRGEKVECPLFSVGDMVAVGPLVFCGRCDFCLDGRLELCEGYREIAQAWPGGFAQYIAIPKEAVERGTIERIPPTLDPSVAAVAEPVASCINAQEKGRIQPGETVVVLGAGPIGSIHILLARIHGAGKVLVADVDSARLKYCEELQPDRLIDASTSDIVSEAKRLTGGKGPDVVITANPSPASQVQAVEMARKGGRVLLFGGLPKEQSKPAIDTNIIHYNALHVIGTTIFAPRHYATAIDLLASGRIEGERIVTHRFSLAEFARGVELAMQGQVRKAVFLP